MTEGFYRKRASPVFLGQFLALLDKFGTAIPNGALLVPQGGLSAGSPKGVDPAFTFSRSKITPKIQFKTRAKPEF